MGRRLAQKESFLYIYAVDSATLFPLRFLGDSLRFLCTRGTRVLPVRSALAWEKMQIIPTHDDIATTV